MADPLLMTLRGLADAVGGEIRAADAGSTGFSSVCIDSRQAAAGALFVALAGSAQDGHDYLEAALAAGAGSALVARSRMQKDGAALTAAADRHGAALVVVPDTLAALQAAAAAYLDGFPDLMKIGITGSSGKTTTKELAAAMLAGERRVVMNPGNFNSETGLPLSAFMVRREHQVGVFELGMNRVGEIGELARVLRPRIALITNVGSAHIGILGSKDAIAKEKKEVFSRFTGSELALIPDGDAYAAYLAQGVQGRVRAFGPDVMSAFGGTRSLGLDGTEVLWAGVPVRLALPGRFNLLNALGAAAIAEEAGVSADAIRRGMSAVAPLFGRGEILRGSVTVVRDCYNANPEATAAALEFCDSLDWPGRRIYVIGSMLELGAASAGEHRRIGQALAGSRADLVFLYGPETESIRQYLREQEEASAAPRPALVFRTDDMETLKREISAAARPGDLVLLKGSRGTALERLTDLFDVKESGPCS